MEPEHFESLYPDATRFLEIEKIIECVKEGNSCQLVSLPGVGRSTLLRILAYNKNVRIRHLDKNQKNFHFVYLNFSEIRKKPLIESTKYIFLGLIDSLRERKMTKEYNQINKIFKESVLVKDELVLFSGLKKTIDYLALEKNLNIVLLFDRFEEYILSLNQDFFTNLRVLRNRTKYSFSVVFSLNRPLEDTLEPTLMSDFYEFVVGKIIYLPIYDKPGVDFRISYLEKITHKKINKTLLDGIFELTMGHNNLIRLCVENILSSDQKFENKLELRRFLIEQKAVRSALFGIWNHLTPFEQNALANNNFTNLIHLENVGLVKNNILTISLFGDYVKEKSSSLKETASIQINDLGEAVKGEINFSDRLTALEFKLLKYFIENKDRILEKEEIINTVWGDQKTVLGVTDQALDQLIFRLRKKIEDNPNQPQYIQTIKGRGFKFAN
ncbi:MAG: winged helix-turn-helix domain-containing protein [Candidatus Levybacteria bacterium]|nr:winged helix-turn-helix domain-containing protein [Candidatus Levybacteria bacterium]